MITSTSSAQVKHVLLLQNKAKARREYEAFVVEGAKMVAEAPRDRIEKVYVSETYAKGHSSFLQDLDLQSHQIEVVSDPVLERMSDTQTPQGVMAVIKMQHYNIEEMISEHALLIGIENLQDPGNLGTIIRMGDAAGVTGVFMSATTVDIYNPKAIRSTMGSIYRVPFVYAADFLGTVQQLKDSGVCVCAAHLKGTKNYTKQDYKKATAFLIGNEANGLTEQTAKSADELVKIPMSAGVDSLNAAIACTVLVFEAVRQRG